MVFAVIKFIFGRAKSGKTTEVLKRIKQEVENGNSECVLLVPEQTSFEYEKALLHILGDGKFTSVPVLSFTRLVDEVSRLAGGKSGKRIDDAKRTVLMSRALFNCKDKLKVFSKYVSNISFVRNIINTVSELKRCGIESEDIKTCIEKLGDGALAAKLSDIDIISNTYSGLIKTAYIDPEDDMSHLAIQLSDYAYFAGKTVYVDAFKNFTGAQLRVLSEVIRQADETVFSFCFDESLSGDTKLFSAVNETVKEIKKTAQKYGTPIKVDTVLDVNYFETEELKVLERSLSLGDIEPCSAKTENIVVTAAATAYDEAEYAAREIRRLVREENYRYRDFAVIARQDEQYRSAVEHIFKKYDVPCFTDKRYSVSYMPISVFVSASLTAATAFDTESILKYLKTELCDLNFEEISALENYVYMWDIDKSDWKNDWTMSPSGFEKFDDADKSSLEELNVLRKKVISPLLKLSEEIKTADTISSALWQHIKRLNVGEKLSNLSKELSSLDSALLPQAYNAVISILDSLHDTLIGAACTVDEYITYFRLATDSTEIGIIPQMVDEVIFGAADRIKPHKPKIIFLLGANQGVFPAQSAPTGIIGGGERGRLLSLGLPIKDHGLDFAIDEQYLVYTTLCTGTQKLYVSYSSLDAAGKEAKPSSVVDTLYNVFPNCKKDAMNRESFSIENIETPAAAFTGLLRNFDNKSLTALLELFKDMPEYSGKLDVALARKNAREMHLSPEISERLYSKNMRLSATGVDTFFRCGFSYFCRYGLRAKVIKKAEIDVLQRGTIVHEVLEKLISRYKSEYKNLSDEQIKCETDIIVEEYLARIEGIEFVKDNRFMHLVSTIKKMTVEVAVHIRDDFAQSGFEPEFCELKIGDDGDIESALIDTDKGSVRIHGAIDRVDTCGAYIRVVDYKTGSRKFNLSDVLYGLNMQMLIYLYATLKSERFADKIPAGVLYLETGKKVDEEKNFVMNGLLSQNTAVHDEMEKENEGRFVPKLRIKKDGSFYKSKEFIDEKDFYTIFSHVEKMLKAMNSSLLSGELSLNPTDEREKDACKYCDFASVCGIENRPHRKVPPMDNETVTERMGEKADV